MIHYTLRCSQGHHFDDWFASSSDYDAKAEAGELKCPECGDAKIGKAIMAPSVGSASTAAEPACACCAQEGSCPWAA